MEYKSGAISAGDSISEGWNFIKDDYWTFFGMSVITILTLIVASMILGFVNNLISMAIFAAFGVAVQNAGDAAKMSAMIVPQIISLFISIFTNLIVVTLSGMLFCGMYSALARKVDTGMVEFGDLFNGFQKVVPCLVAGALSSIIQFGISLVMLVGGAAIGVSAFGLGSILNKNGQPDPAMLGSLIGVIAVFFIVFLILNLIFAALTTFIYPLIADRNLSGGEAFMTSVKSGLANIGGILLLLILCGLMALGGILACVVGLFFVSPVVTAALFAAYRKVFGVARDFRRHTPPSPPVFGNQPGY